MTHGDAVVVLRRTTSPREKKLEALDVIFSNELKYDYNCLHKPELWGIIKFLYEEITEDKGVE